MKHLTLAGSIQAISFLSALYACYAILLLISESWMLAVTSINNFMACLFFGLFSQWVNSKALSLFSSLFSALAAMVI